MVRKVNINEMKKEIELKYRLYTDPKIEYLSAKDIRKVFLPFVKNLEEFNKLSDEEIVQFYIDWYKEIVKSGEEGIHELYLPNI